MSLSTVATMSWALFVGASCGGGGNQGDRVFYEDLSGQLQTYDLQTGESAMYGALPGLVSIVHEPHSDPTAYVAADDTVHVSVGSDLFELSPSPGDFMPAVSWNPGGNLLYGTHLGSEFDTVLVGPGSGTGRLLGSFQDDTVRNDGGAIAYLKAADRSNPSTTGALILEEPIGPDHPRVLLSGDVRDLRFVGSDRLIFWSEMTPEVDTVSIIDTSSGEVVATAAGALAPSFDAVVADQTDAVGVNGSALVQIDAVSGAESTLATLESGASITSADVIGGQVVYAKSTFSPQGFVETVHVIDGTRDIEVSTAADQQCRPSGLYESMLAIQCGDDVQVYDLSLAKTVVDQPALRYAGIGSAGVVIILEGGAMQLAGFDGSVQSLGSAMYASYAP